MTSLFDRVVTLDKRWLAAYFLLILMGLGISVRQPPFYMPDEGAHYLRAYEVSQLHLVNFRGNVGADIACNEYITAAKKYHLTPNVQKKAEEGQTDPACTVRSMNTAGAYSFISYIPAAVGLRAAQASGWVVEDRLSLARFLNFAVWFSILFCGLMFIQKGRLLLACMVLMPTFFWQLAALSADGASFASCVGYVCVVVGLIQRGQPVSTKALKYLLALAILIGGSKGVYALLALFSFSLWDQLPNRSWRYKLVALGSPTLTALATFLLFTAMADPTQVFLGNGAVPASQLRYVIENPLAFSGTLVKTFFSTQLEGLLVPRYAVPNPRSGLNMAIIMGVAILVLMFRSDFGVGRRVRYWAAGLAGVGFASFCLPLYLTYTPVGFGSILGIQGRYYLPLLPLVFVALASRAGDFDWRAIERKSAWIIAGPVLFLVWACWNIK